MNVNRTPIINTAIIWNREGGCKELSQLKSDLWSAPTNSMSLYTLKANLSELIKNLILIRFQGTWRSIVGGSSKQIYIFSFTNELWWSCLSFFRCINAFQAQFMIFFRGWGWGYFFPHNLNFSKFQCLFPISSLCVNSITLLKKFQEWDADPFTLLLDPCMLSFK